LTACTACQVASFSTNSSTFCTLCDTGRYNGNAALTSSVSCIACKPGRVLRARWVP
jgi:hypothetical protein